MTSSSSTPHRFGFAEVNGLALYYEIYGAGGPLVLIHGGGSTIETCFGRLIPLLAGKRQVIALEMQAHGRTADRELPLSFEQDADDVAALLHMLSIGSADVLGFSNGATTAMQLAIRHPHVVRSLVLGSGLAKRHGMPEWFWDFIRNEKLESMPAVLREGFLRVCADPVRLQRMFDRDVERMLNFQDIPDNDLLGITMPTLIVNGDRDVVSTEHARELHRLIPQSELLILSSGHGQYIGELSSSPDDFNENDLIVPVLERFFERNESTS